MSPEATNTFMEQLYQIDHRSRKSVVHVSVFHPNLLAYLNETGRRTDLFNMNDAMTETQATMEAVTAAHDGIDASRPVTALVGALWGDEGKGKAIDYLCASGRYACVARCAGGVNSAHTVVVPTGSGSEETKKCVLRVVPSSILCDGATTCVVGPGVTLDILWLVDELTMLERDHGVDWRSRVRVSDRAHVLLTIHRALDAHHERVAASSGSAVGTTRRGVGPCYTDKAARRGIRVADLAHRDRFVRRVRALLGYHARAHPPAVAEILGLDAAARVFPDNVLDAAAEAYAVQYVDSIYKPMLVGIVCDTVPLLNDVLSSGKRVLVECSQSTMLDIDHGTYPHVTSSSATAGGAVTGLGVPPGLVSAIGVAKAYTTRVVSYPEVRAGCPFPTRLPSPRDIPDDDVCSLSRTDTDGAVGYDKWDIAAARHIPAVGREIDNGGHPRMCGWFDAVVVRRAHMVNGFTALVLNKLDTLTGLERVKIAVAYELRPNSSDSVGAVVADVPENMADIVRPIYEVLDGWTDDIGHCRTFDQLPESARAFVRAVERIVGCPVGWIGVGPARSQMIPVPLA